MYTGPHLIKDELLFGYDSGYGVADNHTATRFYKGEPTTNAVPLVDFLDTSNWTGNGWSGAIAVSTDYPNTLELTSTNGWRTYCIDTGITSGGTVSFSYEYRGKSIDNLTSYMMNLNGTHLGSYTNGLGGGTNADLRSGKWIKVTKSWTANSDSKIAIGSRGNDGYGLSDVVYVRNFQVELNGHVTPYTESSRSSTDSLIDLKRTTNIDVSNISFDSTGQPNYDGTDDVLSTGLFSGRNPSTSPFTIEAIVKSDTTSGSHMWLDVNGNGSNQRFYCAHASDGSSTPMGIQNSGWSHSVPQDTNYHHYVITMNGSTATLYNNGTSHSSKSYTSYTLPSNIQAGGRGGYSWLGRIPVFKVYNQVLTTDQIKQNYNAYKNRFNI